MKLLKFLLLTPVCLAPAILMAAAGGIPGPNQHPQPKPDAADVKVEWGQPNRGGDQVNLLGVIVVVSDAKTGLPVQYLSAGNFKFTFATVNLSNACPASPTIQSVFEGGPGVYRILLHCGAAWTPGEWPVALTVYSNFEQIFINSPGSYQGQAASTAEIR